MDHGVSRFILLLKLEKALVRIRPRLRVLLVVRGTCAGQDIRSLRDYIRKRFGLIGIQALVGLEIGKELGACALVHLVKRIGHPGAPRGPLL